MNNREHHYLHLNSQHLNWARDNSTEFTLHLEQPIKRCRRVALKSLSLPNTGFNIGSNDKVLRWIEGYRQNNQFKVFSVTLDVGYYTATDLCNEINTKILAMAQHTFATETAPTITFSFNSDFHIQIALNSGATQKVFAPFFTGQSNLWRKLGFDKSQGIDHQSNPSLSTQTNALASMSDIVYGQSVKDYAALISGSTALTDAQFLPFVAMPAAASTTLVAGAPTTIENFAGLFVSTDLSLNSSWETHIRDGRNSVAPTHILEWVPNNVSRFSYLNHDVNMLSYHRLYQDEITDFKIILKDFDGAVMNHEQIKEFNMVLVIETETEDPSLTDEEEQALWSRSWAKNHPTRVLQ